MHGRKEQRMDIYDLPILLIQNDENVTIANYFIRYGIKLPPHQLLII